MTERPRTPLSVRPIGHVVGGRAEAVDEGAVDGTPVLDVKPYIAEFAARGEVRRPSWSTELLADYSEVAEPGGRTGE